MVSLPFVRTAMTYLHEQNATIEILIYRDKSIISRFTRDGHDGF